MPPIARRQRTVPARTVRPTLFPDHPSAGRAMKGIVRTRIRRSRRPAGTEAKWR